MKTELIKFIDAMNLGQLREVIEQRITDSRMKGKGEKRYDILDDFETFFESIKQIETDQLYFNTTPMDETFSEKLAVLRAYYCKRNKDIYRHLSVLSYDLHEMVSDRSFYETTAGSASNPLLLSNPTNTSNDSRSNKKRVGSRTVASSRFHFLFPDILQPSTVSPSLKDTVSDKSDRFIGLISAISLPDLVKAINLRQAKSRNKDKQDEAIQDEDTVLYNIEQFFSEFKERVYVPLDHRVIPKDINFLAKVIILESFYRQNPRIYGNLMRLISLYEKDYSDIYSIVRNEIYAGLFNEAELKQGDGVFRSGAELVAVVINKGITSKSISNMGVEGAIAMLFRPQKTALSLIIEGMFSDELKTILNEFYSDMLASIIRNPLFLQEGIEAVVSIYKEYDTILFSRIELFLSSIKERFNAKLALFTGKKEDHFDKLIQAYKTMCFEKVMNKFLEDEDVKEDPNYVNIKIIISSIVSIMESCRKQEIDPVAMLKKILVVSHTGIDFSTDDDTMDKPSDEIPSSRDEFDHSNSDGSVSSVSAPVPFQYQIYSKNSSGVSSVSTPVKSARDKECHGRLTVGSRDPISIGPLSFLSSRVSALPYFSQPSSPSSSSTSATQSPRNSSDTCSGDINSTNTFSRK